MSVRSRLLAVGASAALVGGALAVTPAPAHAAPAQPTAIYSCVPTLLHALPLPAVDVPVDLDVLDSVTVPVGGTLAQVTGSLGLGALAGLVSNLLVTVDGLTVTLNDKIYDATVSKKGAITLPALPVPEVPGSFPVTLPQKLDIDLLGGLVGGLLGTASCTIKGTDRLVTTLLVTGATAPGGSGGSGGTGAGPVVTGGSAVVSASRSNPCVTTPARKAGQRPTRLTAKAAKVSWKKRPAVKLAVTSKRAKAKGTVIACYGAMKIGQKKLRKGKATLRTVRFYPGRYRVKVVYLGGAHARAKAKTITLRVKR
jgi:hypothetical protein